MNKTLNYAVLGALALLLIAHPASAQSAYTIDAGSPTQALIGQPVTFDATHNQPPPDIIVERVIWEFGDGSVATEPLTSHTYTRAGSYLTTLRFVTDQGTFTDTNEVRIFKHLNILVADNTADRQQIELHQQQAAAEGILLKVLQSQSGGPEVLVEEELTQQLLDIRPDIGPANLIIMWTSGGVGANVLTKFSQHIRQSAGPSLNELSFSSKGIVLVSNTPFAVLKPTAQSAFDQLNPKYVMLTKPPALDLISSALTAEAAQTNIQISPLDYRLLGTFSSRTVSDLGITNFMSFGINFLVNRGVPINSIILILMLPVIATILAFARQVIGIKAFGLITPAMTTVSFLVMGLTYGLIVFLTIVLVGTFTRLIMRRLRLLYLPRMALVLTSVSLALLVLLGLGVANDRTSVLSFSIFPALILTILAEEFISAQFKSGVRTALTVTAWTLILATVCYFIVSSELFRTLILSFPEITLLAIPINLVLGQFVGLRLTEYFRFRELLRHGQSNP